MGLKGRDVLENGAVSDRHLDERRAGLQSAAMDAWVIGGTGLVGRSLVDRLLERPEVRRVTSVVRRTERGPHARLEEVVADFERLADALAGRAVSHAFCCLGTTMAKAGSEAAFRKVDHDYALAFAQAARRASAKTLLLVSAMGANPKSAVFYNRVKGEAEASISELGLPTLHIARPSLLLGDRVEHRPGERMAITLGRPLGRLMVGPLKKYAPIEARDVAEALVRLAFSSESSGVRIHPSDELARLVLG